MSAQPTPHSAMNGQNSSVLDKRFMILPTPQTKPANNPPQTMYRTIGPVPSDDLPEQPITAIKGHDMVLTKDERSALVEGCVWKRLNGGGADGLVYSCSGPGPVSKYSAMTALVTRGWFADRGGWWEITPDGERAASAFL